MVKLNDYLHIDKRATKDGISLSGNLGLYAMF